QASGGISDRAQLVGHDGKVISRGGAPALAFSYQPAGQRFNPLTLASGTWPSGPAQIDIDAATASKDHFSVGQSIGVVARGPEQRFRIVGTVKFGGVSSLGGATMAVFSTATAQKIFNKQGKLGASRRQVLRSVMVEARVIGLVASLAGLFLGLALAKGLNALLRSFGIDLPHASTVFATRTVVVSLVVGVLITLLAALRPALR